MSVSLEELCDLVGVNYAQALRAAANVREREQQAAETSDTEITSDEEVGSSYHPSEASEGEGDDEELEADTGMV